MDELTKMLDSQGVRQLAETIEAVRATAQEQVPYNTENVRPRPTFPIAPHYTIIETRD